ncbi:hypothetical protein RI103_35080 [Paraburkholderia sp. FT54]|uniref:hypothetical protein n=1 Tax=Paraburkholderia sp. FT54 TaxID=3074437 RepID=UPI002877B2D1|nr:hypothetical protein [Paraburkholderia sp. FT54]WNC94395.1 hypothetical protein RI103_35080 [Paraburkholderia sp. FT54]
MKPVLLPTLLTLLCGIPIACHAQNVSIPQPQIANPPALNAPPLQMPTGSSVSGKGARKALQTAMHDDIARANLQFLDNLSGGVDMINIDHDRKPESTLFVHNIYVDR